MGAGKVNPPPPPSEAPVTTTTCNDCGYHTQPDGTRRNNRALLNIIDELGAATICSVCAALTVIEADGLQITLMVSRPTLAGDNRGWGR